MDDCLTLLSRFSHPGKLVSYFGLNPRVRQSGLGPAHYGRISKVGRSHARAMLVEAAWSAAEAPDVRPGARRFPPVQALGLRLPSPFGVCMASHVPFGTSFPVLP